MNLFIDTNRYLGLFGLNEKKQKEIEKLIDYIKKNNITLWLPEQTEKETLRNMYIYILPQALDKEIKKLPKPLCEDKLQIIDSSESKSKELIELNKKYIKEHNKLIDQIPDEIEKNLINKYESWHKLIIKFFEASKTIPTTEELLNKAAIRHKLGDPPGKKGSYGDAIIWEALLNTLPNEEDLTFIGFDNDFSSKLNKQKFSECLIKEWSEKNKSNIVYFKHIGDFTKANIPELAKSSDNIIADEKKADCEYLLTNAATLSAFADFSKYNSALMESLMPTKAILDSIKQSLAPINMMKEFLNQTILPMKELQDTLQFIGPFPKNITTKQLPDEPKSK